MTPAPIFIGITRSFLLGILPALLTAVDILFQMFSDPAVGGPVARAIAFAANVVTGVVLGAAVVDAEQVEATMRALAPVYAFIVAQQRAGAARPYTMDPRALK